MNRGLTRIGDMPLLKGTVAATVIDPEPAGEAAKIIKRIKKAVETDDAAETPHRSNPPARFPTLAQYFASLTCGRSRSGAAPMRSCGRHFSRPSRANTANKSRKSRPRNPNGKTNLCRP